MVTIMIMTVVIFFFVFTVAVMKKTHRPLTACEVCINAFNLKGKVAKPYRIHYGVSELPGAVGGLQVPFATHASRMTVCTSTTGTLIPAPDGLQ